MVTGTFRTSRTTNMPGEIHPCFSMKNHSPESMMKHAGPNHVATRNSPMASVASVYWGPLDIASTIAPETPPAQVAYRAVPTGEHDDRTHRHSRRSRRRL